MDRKSIIVLLASFGMILLWFQLVQKLWPPQPKPRTSTTNTLTQAIVAPDVPAPATTRATNQVAFLEPEKLFTLESDKATYTFTSHGGGIRSVAFKDYDAVVACGKRQAQGLATVNSGAPVPILGLMAPNLFGLEDQFELRREKGLVASHTYSNGLHLSKTFNLASNYVVTATVRLENTSDQPLLIPPHAVVIGAATPTSNNDEQNYIGIYHYDGEDDTHIDASWFANRTLGCFPGTPKWLYRHGQTNTVWGAVHNQFFTVALIPQEPADQLQARPVLVPPWRPDFAALTTNQTEQAWQLTTNDVINTSTFLAHLRAPNHPISQFLISQFSSPVRGILETAEPTQPTSALQDVLDELNRLLKGELYQPNRSYFNQLELTPPLRQLVEEQPRGEYLVRLNRLLMEKAYPRDLRPCPTGYEAALTYQALSLGPGEVLSRDYVIYAGPREYNTLAKLGKQLGHELDKVMGYGGFFGWFAKGLLLSMNGLNSFGLSYAAAIIVITFIIKTLFWPLTNASTRSMKRMAALQPQMKALQERFKDDPVKMNRKLMEFMKEHKVSPLGGCLPMLLQLPVFFGFFTMIRSAIELRGARFLWVCDLSQPDTLFIIPGFNVPFNLLPLIMGATMLWQARMTPPSPGMDPAQQKIMRYMPLMFLVILYNFSAGLTLYWTVQNLLTITQMKLTKAKTDPAPTTPAPSRAARPQLQPKKPRRKP